MAEGAPLVGVAITGTPDPPTGFEVPLPWQAQGRSRTGLDKPNAAVCCWFVTFTAADVIDAIGHVPPEPMRRIEEAIRAPPGRFKPLERFSVASHPPSRFFWGGCRGFRTPGAALGPGSEDGPHPTAAQEQCDQAGHEVCFQPLDQSP